jgi:hypothetical protein
MGINYIGLIFWKAACIICHDLKGVKIKDRYGLLGRALGWGFLQELENQKNRRSLN